MGAPEIVSFEEEIAFRNPAKAVSPEQFTIPESGHDPTVDRFFGASALSVPHLKAPVLQRAQRLYGNQASGQIVMRARALQRRCACGGTCEKCQAAVLNTQGEPLQSSSRRPLENHFQIDLADIRIHTGAEAAESARNLDALAYTSGRDIYFAHGMYAPSSTSGHRLLAHEVAHVVQQSSGKEPSIATKSAHGPKIGAPDDPLEYEAEGEAEDYIHARPRDTNEAGKRAPLGTGPGSIQRQSAPGVHVSYPTAPHDKSAPEVESMYRRAGLQDAANAVRQCREGNCSHVLTEAEAYEAYRTGRLSAGLGEPSVDERRTSSSPNIAAGGVLTGAVVAGTLPAGQTAVGASASTALERAALRWGTAEVIEGGTAASTATVTAGTVAIPVAAGIYLVVATVALLRYASFQTTLQREGYTILPNPFQVCIAGCHQPAAPDYKPIDPGLWEPLTPLGPSDFSKPDLDALRRWVEAEPQHPPGNGTTNAPPETDPGLSRPITAGPAPKPRPVMDPALPEAEKRKWERCNELYEQYKKTQGDEAGYGENLRRLRLILQSGNATPPERHAFCLLLRLRIQLVKQLLNQRMEYLANFCDEFDWFSRGTTPQQRANQHWLEVQNVTAHLNQLEGYLRQFCP
ncbi:MAG: DUF4157 domain-containing protein [Acidobacteriaceae bacterium]|nr:DUF4157 domain-containing protein [Acidobacteriaceae bacterium]